MGENSPVTIIIHPDPQGFHGGAWKVAYADFVTAMMAFFLLLWLLSTTPQEVKQGLAEYFTPTIGLKDQIGIGSKGGISPTDDGEMRSDKSTVTVMEARPQQGVTPELSQQSQMEGEQEAKLFEKAEAEMKKAMESDPNLREFRDNVFVEQTPEGLKLELRDTEDKPMFDPGSDRVSRFGQDILSTMAPIIEKVPNHISVTGHTDAAPLNRGGNYTNWELSTDRAQSARRFLESQNIGAEKTGKITGRAAQDLLLPDQPGSARNRRIEIILLKGSHLETNAADQVAPRTLLTPPNPEEVMRLREERIGEAINATPAQAPATPAAPDAAAPAAPAPQPANVLDATPLPPVQPATPLNRDPQLERIRQKMQEMKSVPALATPEAVTPETGSSSGTAAPSKPSSVLDAVPIAPVGG